MGLTHVTTTVRRLAGRGKGYEAEFLVDTGAVDCLAPANALHKAGIKPEGKNVYELADGSPVELEYGFARVSLMGQETVTPIIFGPDGSEPILGVLALEGLGISVDPKTRPDLIPIVGLKPADPLLERTGQHQRPRRIGVTTDAPRAGDIDAKRDDRSGLGHG
jgi:clan AA aspartic protease